MKFNERDLKTKIETVINTELLDLTKLFRKQFSQITDDKCVKFKLHEYDCIYNHMSVTTKSMIIDDGYRYICIDSRCNTFDISTFELSLTKLAGLAKTLAIAIDKMANAKDVTYLGNDFSDYYGEIQLMIETAFTAAKSDTLIWYYLNYDLIINNSTGYLKVAKRKTREDGDAGETVLLINNGLCLLKKMHRETTMITNMILDSQMVDCDQ